MPFDQTVSLGTFFVEDNFTIRENLVATLKELVEINYLGYAETEAAGIGWLTRSENAWDVAIVDIFLQQGSGLGILAACKNRLPHQHVIVLSNYATPDVRKRCKELGADAVFDKSNDIDSLLEYCANVF